jgi:hypothetical protein
MITSCTLLTTQHSSSIGRMDGKNYNNLSENRIYVRSFRVEMMYCVRDHSFVVDYTFSLTRYIHYTKLTPRLSIIYLICGICYNE